MTAQNDTTRRAALAGVAVAPFALIGPADGTSSIASPWQTLADQLRTIHPRAPEAVECARDAGLNHADFSGIISAVDPRCGLQAPVLSFGDRKTGNYTLAAPNALAHVRMERSR